MEFKETNYKVESIASVEQLEDFDNEYVYDIEVDDTHMFFANDILVHNSIYVEFGRVVKWCGVPKDRQTKFIVDLWKYAVGPYMSNKYDEYAKSYNCDKNLQNLELEKIADTTIYFAKKRYAMAEAWKEPGIYLRPMEKVVHKGTEIVKGTTPSYVRECLIDFVEFVLEWYQNNEEKISYESILAKLKKYKEVFMIKSPEEISTGAGIGDYEKFILDDKKQLTVAMHCPIHVKAAAVANLILNRPKNKKYKVKYNTIKSGDKVRWYYTKDREFEVFGFLPGAFPGEYALEIDRDVQFEKTVLSFCNKIIEILGYMPLTSNLCYSAALF